MWIIKALALTIQKCFNMVKLLKSRPDSEVKVTRSTLLISMEQICYYKYSCEISRSQGKGHSGKKFGTQQRSSHQKYSCKVSNL